MNKKTKLIVLVAVIAIILGAFVLRSEASTLECPVGQVLQEEISHTEKEVEYVYKGFNKGDYIKIGSHYIYVGHNKGFYDKEVTETVVIDQEEECVEDPNYVPEAPQSEDKDKDEVKSKKGGSSIIWCSATRTEFCKPRAETFGNTQTLEEQKIELISKIVALLQQQINLIK